MENGIAESVMGAFESERGLRVVFVESEVCSLILGCSAILAWNEQCRNAVVSYKLG